MQVLALSDSTPQLQTSDEHFHLHNPLKSSIFARRYENYANYLSVMCGTALLNTAQANKKDEFYTCLSDIEAELKYYKPYFKGKTVYCNCDDSAVSNFTKFFVQHFQDYGIKN